MQGGLMLEPLFGTFLDPKPLSRSPQLTAGLLAQAVGCTVQVAEKWLLPLQYALMYAELNTKDRFASFLAQIGHESGSFKWTTELWGPTKQQLAYEGRLDLGNTMKGDGYRYRGRGLIQTTGRANYVRVARDLRPFECPDFEANPDALCEPKWAALSAASFWKCNGLNALADKGDVLAITRRVNGGTNGLDDRIARFMRAKEALS